MRKEAKNQHDRGDRFIGGDTIWNEQGQQ